MTNSELLTVQEVCDMLKVAKGTVYLWAKIGVLKSYHITKRTIRFKRNEVIKSLKVEGEDGRDKAEI